MTQSSFGFQWTSTSLAISLIAVVSVCALSWLAWKRSGFRSAVLALELLRVLLVCVVVFLLNQPESVESFRPSEQPTVVLLGDQSFSMDTQDVGLGSGQSTPLLSRRKAIEPIVNTDNWDELAARLEIVSTPFDSDVKTGGGVARAGEAGGLTNIHAALQRASEEHSNLRAIVLASDGDWNDGPPPVQAAAGLRLEQVPIFVVPVGSRSRLPDLDLVSFDLPTSGVTGKNVRIPFTIESSLPRDHVVQVELQVSDGSKLQRQVHVAAMGRTSDAILWKPESTGDFSLMLKIPDHPDEKIAHNNSREAPISISDEQLRVLIIESFPRWEYRYLRNALSRDPGVELNCLLFHPGLNKVGGGNRDYIGAFPDEELTDYEVVFLGDVGMQPGQLTEEQCRRLKGLVEQQASGLVFMPGLKGNMLSLSDSPLAELLPVVLDEVQPMGWGSQTPSHFALTETGRKSLLTKLADSQDENNQIWENLPGFQWHAPVIRSKAGADVLAVHQESSNEYGRVPLLVTRTFGTGKILFMGTDGAWRWRRGVEDRYHYRFWGQVVRWMAYRRTRLRGELMRAFFLPQQPQVRQTVTFHSIVMQKGGEPLSQGNVTARIVAPSGRSQAIQLNNTGAEWGAFAGVFTPAEPGSHQVTLRCEENGSAIETSLFVQGASLEQVGKPARPEVLEELARVTGGQVLDGSDLTQIIAAVAAVPEPPERIRRVQLWSHPLVAAALILLLGLFWVGRKVVGFI